jgi:hypothetical protein
MPIAGADAASRDRVSGSSSGFADACRDRSPLYQSISRAAARDRHCRRWRTMGTRRFPTSRWRIAQFLLRTHEPRHFAATMPASAKIPSRRKVRGSRLKPVVAPGGMLLRG